VIVRWGIRELPGVLAEIGGSRPLVVTTARWRSIDVPGASWFDGVRPHAAVEAVQRATEAAAGADSLVAIGGGSAVDSGKAVSAATGLPLVSVPTTYAGAEWTRSFGMRDEARGVKAGGSGARLAGIVYEPRLTLELPRAQTVGTALNALAHAAEALYVKTRSDDGDRHALAAAPLISRGLPRVVDRPHDLERRTELLRGACEAGAALGASGLALGHAMAQALGGRYGLPHGALNAICLPPALRFNEPVAGEAIRRFGDAMEVDDPVATVEELARLGGFTRLRELGVPADDLEAVAESVVVRAGAKANPREASAAEVAELLRSVW
jgi:maleylacetate reductase